MTREKKRRKNKTKKKKKKKGKRKRKKKEEILHRCYLPCPEAALQVGPARAIWSIVGAHKFSALSSLADGSRRKRANNSNGGRPVTPVSLWPPSRCLITSPEFIPRLTGQSSLQMRHGYANDARAEQKMAWAQETQPTGNRTTWGVIFSKCQKLRLKAKSGGT